MSSTTFVVIFLACIVASYFVGRGRSVQLAGRIGGISNLAALPSYYGMLTVLWAIIPALILLIAWILFDDVIIAKLVVAALPEADQQLPAERLNLLLNQIRVGGTGSVDAAYVGAAERYQMLTQQAALYKPILVFVILLLGAVVGLKFISHKFNARYTVERAFSVMLFLCSTIAILTTVGIVLSVLFESLRFFQKVPFTDFLFGMHWSPQIAIRADQVGASGSFGAIPLFAGTLLISFIAMLIAVPVGLMSAIYLSEYASNRVRNIAKPALEILAGIPTVVYGFFAALTVAPTIRGWGEAVGLNVASESALAAGIVMGIMIIPFVSSLSDDVINAVPQSLRDGSYGLGATQSETIRKVIFPAALPGIVGGVLLAVSRAIGETMIVVMAAGLAANLTANPLEAVTTVTVQIVTLVVGDQEFDSAKTLAAFALGLLLFVVTLALNFVALHVVKKYREQYD